MKSFHDLMKPYNIGSADQGTEFSPKPLLDAFEDFHGSWFDLDLNVKIAADDLKRLKSELLSQMTQRGLSPGDRVLTALPNGPLFVAIWAASLEAGASPILVHSDTPDPELERMAARWGATFLATEARNGEDRNQSGGFLAAGQYGAIRWQRREAGDNPGDQLTLVSLPLHPTSGTSGGPKIAVRPGPCAIAEPRHYIETLSIERSDSILCAIPMSHAYAYGMCFLVALLTSAELVFMRRFNPALAHRAFDQMKISVFPAVPIMLDSLLATPATGSLGRPRIVLSAGTPLSRKTFEEFRRQYGLSVRSLYGTTETGGISIGLEEEDFTDSVGIPMRGVEVDLSETSGKDVRVVRVRSSSMMGGYLEGDRISRDQIPDGWFETGDVARRDAQGRLLLQGRLSEVINVFGYKVIPREVEEIILMLPQVGDVKVYAGRHLGPDVVEAAVVCHEPISEAQIIEHCEKHIVSYKCPTAVRFVDALPRTASGKVAVECLAE
jgi:acyl-CoA synthetase (AMP-forming)/AMP-acid ligase II